MSLPVFWIALLLGVPLIALAAYQSERLRGWILAALVFATCLGDSFDINFVSREQYRGPDRGFEVAAADLIALGLAAGLMLRRPGHIAWIPYNTLPMLAFLALAAVSVHWSPVPIYSFFSIFKLLRCYLLYWCVVNSVRTSLSLRALRVALMALAALFVTVALRQKYLLGIYRLPMMFDHPNTVGPYLNQVSALLLMLGLADRRLSLLWATLSTVGAVALQLTVVMTFSRVAMLLGAASLLASVAFLNQRMGSRRTAIVTALLVSGMATGAALSMKSIIERFREAPEASMLARRELNSIAVMMATDHPFGVGVNQFSQVATDEPRYREMLSVEAFSEQTGVCHHIYLLTAAELGWVGLGLLLVVMIRFAWKSGSEMWRGRGLVSMLQGALFLGSLALHGSGFFEFVLRVTAVLFLYLACSGLSVGLAYAAQDQRRRLRIRDRTAEMSRRPLLPINARR